jgi:ubiquinone/menaquinone biosynthesis C-methylase UbiE
MESFDISVKRFDEFASAYAEKFQFVDSYIQSLDKFCDLIMGNKPGILELACGPGNITQYIKNKFPDSEYIAIDLAPNMIDIAKQQVKGVDFMVMDVRKISTLNIKFDAIMCSFCLPFLSKSDTYKLIADCADRLKENGAIYISTMEGDESKAGFETTSFSGDSEIYFNYHKQEDIEKALIENGFIIGDFKRQDYVESDGSVLIDMIFTGIIK